jgi:putative transposase
MTRLHGWAPKGQRLVDKIPHRRWKTATFLAALRNDRVDAPCLFDGPINGERFRAYVEQFLVPTLKPGDVVILDNLGSHKGKAVRRRSEPLGRASCSCPNTRPTSIQSRKSSPKTLLRKAAARTYDAISDASKATLAQYLPEECGRLHSCGAPLSAMVAAPESVTALPEPLASTPPAPEAPVAVVTLNVPGPAVMMPP